MKRLKIVTRRAVPETNSSSSHSVSICFNGNLTDNLVLDSEGVITIPKGLSFGRGLERYNDSLTKAAYVCASFCDEADGIIDESLYQMFKEAIIDFTGATKVELEWMMDAYEEVTDDGECIKHFSCPTVDHQSYEVLDEVTESKSIMQDFIFNPNSWLFVADDSGTPPGFYDVLSESDEPFYIASIELGGKVGRVDWEIMTDNLSEGLVRHLNELDDTLALLSINNNIIDFRNKYISSNGSNPSEFRVLIPVTNVMSDYVIEGQPQLVLANYAKLQEYSMRMYENQSKLKPTTSHQQILESILVPEDEGVSWVSYPISIETALFGKIW